MHCKITGHKILAKTSAEILLSRLVMKDRALKFVIIWNMNKTFLIFRSGQEILTSKRY